MDWDEFSSEDCCCCSPSVSGVAVREVYGNSVIYPGLAKFFKKKEHTLVKTIYSQSETVKVYDNGRRGTTKVKELVDFLTKENFVKSEDPIVDYIDIYTKDGCVVIVNGDYAYLDCKGHQ